VQACSTRQALQLWFFPLKTSVASSSKEKRSMALLSSSPFFLKAPLRGEGCAARCLLAECLWSSCRQAGRTSWSRTLQAGCGVHPLPGGRQQLAQGARRTGGRLRLTAYQHQQSRRLHHWPASAQACGCSAPPWKEKRADRNPAGKSRYFF